ncbi:hypothetical protein AK812_SmicGene1397 [Symbiodinium microadriaticum]|uniref:Uncharacterized protein n=1 Tax=Symbiodinium microadriaticum TaxID=2951 RepID=A0A1Q9F474_SYMMI|nr:hypothetical protein AK812_SmicGene1397 [Symbiodinium microadriaticum]
MATTRRAQALDLAVFFHHHEATRLLLAARASLEGGFSAAVLHAANADNAEGIRLLCASGTRPLSRSLFGVSALQCAAGLSAAEALEELVAQALPNSCELSRALFDATAFKGGSAELVQRLISLRADVDFQMSSSRDFSALGRLLLATKSLQHRFGTSSVVKMLAYHLNGTTPLMQAIRSAQFEAAAALIAAGARLDLRNSKNWTAADFARNQAIPRFLQLGLEGAEWDRQKRIDKGKKQYAVPASSVEEFHEEEEKMVDALLDRLKKKAESEGKPVGGGDDDDDAEAKPAKRKKAAPAEEGEEEPEKVTKKAKKARKQAEEEEDEDE